MSSWKCEECGAQNHGSLSICVCGDMSNISEIIEEIEVDEISIKIIYDDFDHKKNGFIINHWRGYLPLGISFWINVFLLNILISLLLLYVAVFSPIENPVWNSRLYIMVSSLVVIIVYPWQIIGTWRSSSRRLKETHKWFLTVLVKVSLVLGVISSLGSIFTPMNISLYKTGFGIDDYGNFIVKIVNDGSMIHLKGDIGYGISKEVQLLIESNPEIKGIILDSAGGRVYEGRKLFEIILANSLDTYSVEGCYSACGIAFLAGHKRYLAKGANLGFHQYKSNLKNLNLTKKWRDTEKIGLYIEQGKDLIMFKKQGISQGFLDRIFDADSDNLWYPTIDEMIDAGVIDSVVYPSDLSSN